MIDWNALGQRLGTALAKASPARVGEVLRTHYAAKFGVCRACVAPLGGPSPEQVCTGCHAAEVLTEAAAAQGKAPSVDA